MKPENLEKIKKSFTAQAMNFENKNMSFSKQEYLDYTVRSMNLKKDDLVLEAAAGTCACGRSVAPFVKHVVCLDATPAMLAVGKTEAEKSGIANMRFVSGFVEQIPFDDQSFDIVLSRLAFHHFTEPEKPFAEMSRVLKKGGQFVIINMEAAEEPLRSVEDEIETMRDPSHIKNRSRSEFAALYLKYGYTVTKQETVRIPVSLSAWMDLTDTPEDIRVKIEELMRSEIRGSGQTGFRPYFNEGICFEQRWVMFIGRRG